jgi:hypothetical protein
MNGAFSPGSKPARYCRLNIGTDREGTGTMIRYAFFAMAILGTAAAAAAAVHPVALSINPAHETVLQKNSPFPVLGAITVQQCAVEDCSDVQS